MGCKVRRGDVVEVNLDPSIGKEIAKSRPCVVVQNDTGNRMIRRTIVVPCTGAEEKAQPSPIAIRVPKGKGGLKKDSFVLCDQIRCVDDSRLGEIYGKLPDDIMGEIGAALKISLGLN